MIRLSFGNILLCICRHERLALVAAEKATRGSGRNSSERFDFQQMRARPYDAHAATALNRSTQPRTRTPQLATHQHSALRRKRTLNRRQRSYQIKLARRSLMMTREQDDVNGCGKEQQPHD